MYLEILNEVIIAKLDNENAKKVPFVIKLTPVIYNKLQEEINYVCKLNTTVPIEKFQFDILWINGRSITIVKDTILDETFETKMVEMTAKILNELKNIIETNNSSAT